MKYCGKFRLLVVAGIFCLLLVAPLGAQNAAKLEVLLEKEQIAWSDAVAFALEAADITTPEGKLFAKAEDAFEYALQQTWLPKGAELEGTVKLAGVSKLLMQAFDLNGGLFYRLGKSPHHSYRELCYKGVIKSWDPDKDLSGQEFLYMISKILSIKEETANE